MDKPGNENQDIGRSLRDAVNKSREAYDGALQNFNNILKEGPSALPHPDGILHVRLAGRETKRLLALHHEALARYTDFLLHGTIPNDPSESD